MARADSSPKALIKAAIRSRCHNIALRYPDQNLDRLHGSNGKWLVLCDELFEDVCCDFTIRKLDISPVEKRNIFDAEWVSQVTYELVTKPARPRRRNAQRPQSQGRSCSAEPIRDEEILTPDSLSMPLPASASSTSPTNTNPTSTVVRNQPTYKSETSAAANDPNIKSGSLAPTPTWFSTVLN